MTQSSASFRFLSLKSSCITLSFNDIFEDVFWGEIIQNLYLTTLYPFLDACLGIEWELSLCCLDGMCSVFNVLANNYCLKLMDEFKNLE